MKLTIKEMILISLFTAFTAAMAQISVSIPFSPIPITLQVFAVCLSAIILGSKCGFLSQLVYILLGIMGAPVFAQMESGIHVILGPKGGYLISFPILAYIVGLIVARRPQASKLYMTFAMFVGLVISYVLGTLWLGTVLKLSPTKALVAGVGWYLPLDIVKVIIAAFIGHEVRSALIKANLLKVAP